MRMKSLVQLVVLRVELSFPGTLVAYGGNCRPHRLVFKDFERDLTACLLVELVAHHVSICPGGNMPNILCRHTKSDVSNDKRPVFTLTAGISASSHRELVVKVGALITAGWNQDEKGIEYHRIPIVAAT